MNRPPPKSPLFPYPPLSRSSVQRVAPRPADESVVPRIPLQEVVPSLAVEHVIARVRRLDLRKPAKPVGSQKTIPTERIDRKSTRLNSSHSQISYAVFCLKKK